MDFFGEQRKRTQRSLLLYGLFFLIIFAHIAVALGVMALLLTLFTGGIYYWALMLVVLWTIGSFVIGSFLEYGRLAAGGQAIAQRVGAVRLFVDHSQDAWEHSQGIAHQHEPVPKVHFSARHIAVRDERDFPPVYRRYYEIAQQLAIASGLTMPILYVLPDEQGINGFVAGRHSQDMVLVLTQGALDKLSDEALYGLIGHEYGHILHGDAAFNLQLMVVLAGLQLLYDWSDSVNNFGASSHNKPQNYFDGSFINNAVNQNNPLPQRAIDSHARSTEAQTASFTTHNEWVSYWQAQSQNQQSSAKTQSMWLQNSATNDRQAPRNIWTLFIHGLSFSSMASAQLIKHSFNRERELLADATSVQLTRSPAIMETLQTIHRDSLGSRLTNIADINGLSHFFFASSGADLGDVSWFATHPSLTERMSAINANAYHDFAVQVAKEKRLNQQKIREIYEQRRLGDWGVITANSLSKNKHAKTSLFQSEPQTLPNINNAIDNVNNQKIAGYPNNIVDEKISAFTQSEQSDLSDKLESSDDGLAFVIEQDVIIDGRLQVTAESIGTYKLLKPWQAQADSDLPAKDLISADDMQKVSLPQYVLNHSYHPLGAQALIEAVMLCHQGRILSTTATYDLADIWTELPSDKISATTEDKKILPHTIDSHLLEIVAGIDRRLDSALMTLALKHLAQHDLSENAIDELRLQSESSHSHQSHQHYMQQKKCRTMLMRYQQGLAELFKSQLTADLSKDFADDIAEEGGDAGKSKPVLTNANNEKTKEEVFASCTSPILSLWQALHLQKLLPILSEILNDKQTCAQTSYQQAWQQQLQASVDDIYVQLDLSAQVFDSLDIAEQAMLTLVAYRLSKDTQGQMISALNSCISNRTNFSIANYVTDLRRHGRLIDIDLTAVSDANLQWLLLTAKSLNSTQLVALINTVPTFISDNMPGKIYSKEASDNYQDSQQSGAQIDYNGAMKNSDIDNTMANKPYEYNNYRQWLSTLHTAMLHDTIVSQDEYDCLIALAEHWLGVRELF